MTRLSSYYTYLKWLGIRQIFKKKNLIRLSENSVIEELKINGEMIGNVYRFSGKELPQVLLYQWWFWSNQKPYSDQTRDKSRLETWDIFQKWINEKKLNRDFYIVVEEGKKLVALAWMTAGKMLGEEKDLDLSAGINQDCLKYDNTSAIRVYSDLGKGIGTALNRFMLEDQKKRRKNIYGFWISTDFNNHASIKMNAKLGLKILGKSTDGKRVYMGKGVND